MNATLPRPIRIDEQTVTLSRTEWDAYIAAVEDSSDRLAIARHDARVAERGRAPVERGSFTEAEVRRLLEGTSAVTILRELEHLKKPGSVAALGKLAEALGVSMDALTV